MVDEQFAEAWAAVEGSDTVRAYQHPDSDPEYLEMSDLEVYPGDDSAPAGLNVVFKETIVESESSDGQR